MDYFVQELNENEGVKRTAGIKARDDLDTIFKDAGLMPLEIISDEASRGKMGSLHRVAQHQRVKQLWNQKSQGLNANDNLFVQFPVVGHSVLLYQVFKKLKSRGVKITLFIHDLELIRYATRTDVSRSKRIRLRLEETKILQNVDIIVAHNQQMKKFLIEFGIDEDKIKVLEIFDYLTAGSLNSLTADNNKRGKDLPIVLAGNLRKHKAGFLYKWPESQSINLYGVGYDGNVGSDIHYFGSFPPDKLSSVMVGNFGLVWDGVSLDTCSGTFGEYLRVNNPHKTSLYLSSGLPVIIWDQAALADFVVKNNCGLVVSSIYDIPKKLAKLTNEDYEQLLTDTKIVGQRLRQGYYTRNALKQVISVD